MAQTGYTPISLYYTTTAAAVPTAGNLVAGELALNTNDGKLYYKNSSGVVTLLAGATSGPAGGSTTQVQYNNAGVLAGITGATTNGTALTLVAPVLGTPASGTVTNLTGTASININGTVGATTPATGAFTSGTFSTTLDVTGNSTFTNGLYNTTTGRFLIQAVAGSAGSPTYSFYNNADLGMYRSAADTLAWATGATNRMTLSSTGLAVTGTLTSTLDATIYGVTVGRGGGAVSTNTAVGASAGYSNTTGTYNVFLGSLAGYGNTTANANTAIGYQASYTNSTGANNSSFGAAALYFNTTGGNNTAIGEEALKANTTASNNTAVGYQAGYTNTTGAQNTDVGMKAGYLGTVRTYTTSMGYFAGYSSNGTANTYIGYASGPNNGTASVENYNTGIGAQALNGTTTASNNTAVGYQAGYNRTTGAQNTFIGTSSGFTGTTAAGNTFVGYGAGYYSTGTYNTFVGCSPTDGAGDSMTTGSKNVIIGGYSGNQSGLDIRTASNYIVLSDGDGNPRGVCFNTGGWTFGNGGTSDSVVARSGNGANSANSLYVGYYSATSPINGTISFNVTTNGNVYNTNNSYGSLSDVKLKENITDATPKLEQLCQVRVVNYNFKEGQTQKQLGVIAQELEQVFPGMVDESPDRDAEGNDLGTTTKQVKYSVFVPMLIKAIQELKAEVDSLKSQLNGA